MWLHPSSCNLTLLLDSWQFLIPDEKGKEKAKTNARLKTKTKTRTRARSLCGSFMAVAT